MDPVVGVFAPGFALMGAYAPVWPERVAGGQRFSQPVSMIDMLPTILDLADLPPAEVAMGQSLAPLLLGILEENGVDLSPLMKCLDS